MQRVQNWVSGAGLLCLGIFCAFFLITLSAQESLDFFFFYFFFRLLVDAVYFEN